MDFNRLPSEYRMKVSAHLLGNRIELRALDQGSVLAPSPLVLSAGENGWAVLFRYGAAVLFNLSAMEESTFLAELSPRVTDSLPAHEKEEAVLVRTTENAEGVFGAEIRLRELSLEAIQMVAFVLAKSVVLAHYEADVYASFQTIEPLAENLQKTGKPGARPKDLLRQLGETLLVEARMTGRVELADKPELLWENPQHERLYNLLAEEYEIKERHAILGQKISLISSTAEKVLGLLQHQSSLRVEWYITALIVLEILITLYTLLIHPAA